MADKKLKSLRDKTGEQIGTEVQKLRDHLFRLRWKASNGSLENPNKIREVRRSIARHLTVLGERKRAAGTEGTP